MSARGERFLDSWIRDNVKVVAFPRNKAEGELVAARCIADAARQHISEHELTEAVGNLAAYMFKAMGASAAAAATNRHKPRTM